MTAFFEHVADHFFLEIKYKYNQHHLSSESITENEIKLISLTPLRYNYLLFAIDRKSAAYLQYMADQTTDHLSIHTAGARQNSAFWLCLKYTERPTENLCSPFINYSMK